MPSTLPRRPSRPSQRVRRVPAGKKTAVKERLNQIVENDLIRRVDYSSYREKVQTVYGGRQGALLATCSKLSLHAPLGDRIFRKRQFDLSGLKSILDIGSGAGQIVHHLLQYADKDADLTCFDLSLPMLRRARARLKTDAPRFIAADLVRMPFADHSFDCVTCGYVLEHLPDAELGLREIARVLRPGGKMFLLTSEDTFGGAWTSRVWCCRTYNRHDLRQTCESLGLSWQRELWFTRFHKLLRAGGICVEIQRT